MTTTPAPPRVGKTISSVLGHAVSSTSSSGSTGREPVRLADSGLWDRQRSFYDGDVAGLWGSGAVPHHITGNPVIAHCYARLVVEFLRALPDDEAARPLLLVELGGGSGRFAYLCVQALRELAPTLRFTYVVTDFSAERVDAWAAHPSYAPLLAGGYLDVAVLDADDPGPTTTRVSGRRLAPGEWDGPVVGIANYVFDTLVHDAYVVRAGELREARVTVPADLHADRPAGGVVWSSVPCDALPAGGPEGLAPVLEHYREVLDDTAVLVPTGGLRWLDLVAGLTAGSSCSLVADKGHGSLLELCSQPEPSVVLHGAGFSLMVNFDLLARRTRACGGVAVLPRDRSPHLVVGAFAQGAVADPESFAAAVRDELVDTGPDNYYLLRSLLAPGADTGVGSLLAALRLSRYDPTLLVELLPRLLDVLPDVPDVQRADVERALLRVWDQWFPIGERLDLALCVGLALSAMDRFARALPFLEDSVAAHPDSAPALFSLAVAHRGAGDLEAARRWVDRALDADPGMAQARALRAVVDDELGVTG
ncbi:tetratricopeptide repeat protein [Nocardioides sp. C4-1]|uniref:tetratricopeptide repeat protein n=1 Tax=Nocardioides sp. C4-1 TaxID=3151851 RepID=UPI0032640391